MRKKLVAGCAALGVLLTLAALAPAAPVRGTGDDPVALFSLSGTRGTRAATSLSTGFEPPLFSTGAVAGQQGWAVAPSGTPAPVVSDANPASGDQHLRLFKDPAQDEETFIIAGTPDRGGRQLPLRAGLHRRHPCHER